MTERTRFGDYIFMGRTLRALSLLAALCSFLLVSGACSTAHVRAVTLEEDPHAYFRMARLTSKLAEVMDVMDKDKYGFLVIEGEEPNAYSFADHTAAVDRALINAFNDDELMCILAHEIAHISLGHIAKQIAVSNSKTHAFNTLKESDANVLSLMFKPFSVKAFSREQEIEADLEAVRAIRLFGISSETYVAMLLRLQEFASKGGYGKGGGLLDTHPSMDTRVRKIRESLLQ